jgi:aldehyde dehydrogenase (NAD+)
MSTALDRTTPPVHLRFGDQRLATGTGGVHSHVNPATGQVDALVPLAGPLEVDSAVEAAHLAFQSWRHTKATERRRLLLRLADLVDQNQAEFTRRLALDNGTPVSTGAGSPLRASEWIRYYAGWADKQTSEVTSTFGSGAEFSYTLAQPYGVIGVIITWNGPLVSLAMKIPAALAAGNTVVVKPSELTPFCAELFAELVDEAGFPAGVVNMLPGAPAAGAALVENPLVQKISFTGGPSTASKILQSCAAHIKPAILELGGKSANIIFDDADLDVACLQGTMMSVGFLSGQGCSFPTRMLVQDSIYEEVIDRVTQITKTINVGDPFDPASTSGPVVDQAAMERILNVVAQAERDGARLVSGGSRIGGALADGFYFEPTVFADVDPNSSLAQNEVFGPVLAIIPFSTEAEAIDIANRTRYGLSASIHSANLRRALKVAEELITGEVVINGAQTLAPYRPFGGLGLSGYGKEGGRLGIEEFLRIKSVAIG